MREYVKSFMREFNFPEEAHRELIDVYDVIQKNGIWDFLLKYINEYETNDTTNWDEAALGIIKNSQGKGISEYSVNMVYLICLTKHVRELYEKAGYSYDLFKDTFDDLRCKAIECHNVHSVWGNMEIRFWYLKFFELRLFALGRFQFEKREFWDENDYVKDGVRIKKDDLVINIHIPSNGKPMDNKAIDDAFARAYEVYKDLFPDKIVPFTLRSWLLYPEHRKFLPKNSNILKLMDYFDIISYTEPHWGDWWRIFSREYNDNIDEMPTETSLQRAYVDWVKKGNAPGFGRGILLYKPNSPDLKE